MADSRQFDTTLPPSSSSPLRVTSTELLHLLDISPDALLIVDREGTIVMANAQAAALFGYRREELQQLRLEMLLPLRLRALHDAHRERYFSAPHARAMGAELQLWGQHRDGTEFPVDIS
ncbi:MAG: PAS domain S-box protein, partial [Ktedonobacteraceae bacterium]